MPRWDGTVRGGAWRPLGLEVDLADKLDVPRAGGASVHHAERAIGNVGVDRIREVMPIPDVEGIGAQLEIHVLRDGESLG